MKTKLFAAILVFALLSSALGVGSALAGAYDTQFTSAVTYVNVGTAPTTTLKLYFYAHPLDTTPTSYTLPNAAVNAAGAIFIGNVGTVADGFQGSAYMESDQMMQVTLVQIPMTNTSTVKNRALSNGFVSGGPMALIPTVLKNSSGYSSIFSVQNADTVLNNVTIDIYDATTQSKILTINQDIAAGAAFYVDAVLVPELGTSFSGSAIIQAERADTSDGKIVTSSFELSMLDTYLYSFEGFESGADTMYMPSFLCDYSGAQRSAYAVQNTGSVSTDVTVTYTATNRIATGSETKTVAPGAKGVFFACDVMSAADLGAAVITSTAAPIVAVGKVYGGGLSTAFNGVVMGSEELGLPYVRWATDANYAAGNGQRTYITIQNVGPALVETETIDVEYWDKYGVNVATYTYTVGVGGMPTGAKFATWPSQAGLSEFGIYPDGSFGGAAIVRGPEGSELTAVGRVASIVIYPTVMVAEDYNSLPIR